MFISYKYFDISYNEISSIDALIDLPNLQTNVLITFSTWETGE